MSAWFGGGWSEGGSIVDTFGHKTLERARGLFKFVYCGRWDRGNQTIVKQVMEFQPVSGEFAVQGGKGISLGVLDG